MIGPAPSARGLKPLPDKIDEHAIDFASRYWDLLEAIVRKRMRDVGVPENRIGMLDTDNNSRLAAFHPNRTVGGEVPESLVMLHYLTVGHLDPAAAQRRQSVPTRALEMNVVHRLLTELGEKDAEGLMTLGGCKVRIQNATVSCLWKGGTTNRVVEEFALRMNRETGCLLADVDCGRIVEPGELVGLTGHQEHVSAAASGR